LETGSFSSIATLYATKNYFSTYFFSALTTSIFKSVVCVAKANVQHTGDMATDLRNYRTELQVLDDLQDASVINWLYRERVYRSKTVHKVPSVKVRFLAGCCLSWRATMLPRR